MTNTNQKEPNQFTGWRAKLWPIHSFEMKKFLPLAFILFCLLFNYTLLRDTKDTLIINSAGANVLPYLKGIVVTSAAILFVILYSKATNIFSRENLFYVVVVPFLIFFGLFGFVIYPMADYLHPSASTIKSWYLAAPWAIGIIDIIAYWTYSLFYVMSEIWGSAMVALVFWQFANHIVRISESKRFYGLLAVIANFSLVLSGTMVKFCSEDIQNFVPEGVDYFTVSMYILMGTVVVFGFSAIATYRWMHQNVLNDKKYYDPVEQAGAPKKKKEKPSLKESFKIIMSSPELLFIALLIVAYGVTINLVEVQWKHQLGVFFNGDKIKYNAYMGDFSRANGIIAILFGLFIGSNILRTFSWFSSAAITPIVTFVGGTFLFLFIISKDLVEPLLAILSTDKVTAACALGFIVVVFAKSVKYTLFDPTKEMAYLPLNEELKSKGKAAVDVIGGRLGKAAGGWAQMFLFTVFMTKDVVAIAPAAFGAFVLVATGWLLAVKVLSKKVAVAQERKRLEVEALKAKSES